MRFWHLTLHSLGLRSNKGSLRPLCWFFTIFSSFITAKGVLKHNIEISLRFKHWVQWWSCLRVHILVWVLLQDTSDLIRLTQTVQRTYFIMYELCFTCFKVECKMSYIFRSSSNETIIEILIWTLMLEYAAYKLWFWKFERQGEYC